MDDDYKRNMQQSAAALGHVAMSFRHFSALLIRIGFDAGALNAETLARLRDDTIRELKNAQSEGVSTEIDADAIGQALGMLGPVIDAAIADAKG